MSISMAIAERGERTGRHAIRIGLVLTAALAAWVGVALFGVRPRSGPGDARNFDPDRVAAAELQMWQLYYSGERAELFFILARTLRDQYNLTWAEALPPSFHFARAAVHFFAARDHYEAVLPDLEEGYSEARQLGHGEFDPGAMARAELGWWVARRKVGGASTEEVGVAIARLYAQAYGVPVNRVLQAGRLRAQAADLRDRVGSRARDADWSQIGELLRASYRSLQAAVTAPASRADAVGPAASSVVEASAG